MSSNIPNDAPILSVNELNQYAKGVLEMHIGKVWVSGEISNFSKPASGHWYFTLKDQNAQVRCAMFRNKNQFIRLLPASGQQVLVQGNVSLYPQRGDYQLIVDYLEESGIGALQRQFELLKQKLQRAGLFEQQHKQALPPYPRHIAIITSATGAALQDILRVLANRQMALKISIIPTAVQGNEAAAEISRAIEIANRWNKQSDQPIEAMIVGRGGGSIEDLWPFNEEQVANAIFASTIPIISAVGHETDTTIADLVADVRAATPSVAAEMITAEQDQLAQQLDYLEKQLLDKIQLQLQQHRLALTHLEQRLTHPGQQLMQYRLRFDQLLATLNEQQRLLIVNKKQQLQALQHGLLATHPKQRLNVEYSKLETLQQQLWRYIQDNLSGHRHTLGQLSGLLDSVSPLATLNRGYAILENEQQQVIRRATDVTIGEKIKARLGKGQLIATVTEKIEAKNLTSVDK